jgi:D-serine deaminase-like pyridoxal phosphate-dependent protein
MLIDDLPTPCLLIDLDRLQANLLAMQARADANHVHLRPHVKTHKSVALARRQLDAGATGITVAKPGEAEPFVEAGFDDVCVAFPIAGRHRLERIASLAKKARITFCLDTIEAAREASAFFADKDLAAEVLVEVDCGYGRSGVPEGHPDSIEFVRHLRALPGLRLTGILTHAGHAYHGPAEGESQEEALQRVSNEERDRMLTFAADLKEAGIPEALPGAFTISIGSTPSISAFTNRTLREFRITEIRPGNYIFNDAIQVALSVAEPGACALTVLATVASKHRDRGGQERAFLDAGKKILTTDRGYGIDDFGTIVYNPVNMLELPHAHINALSEEHGWVRVRGGSTLHVGDRVRVIPNHACVTMHTQDRAYLVRGDEVQEEIVIDARGRSD